MKNYLKSIKKNKEQDLKQNLKEDIKTNTITHRNDIKKEKETLKKNYDDTLNNLNQRLKNIIQRYKEKMKELEADLELRLKVEIHELEERKNLHINNLNKVFDDKMNTWKAENINQIKESIKIIKENIDVLKDLENELAQELKVPAISGLKITHAREKLTIPIGTESAISNDYFIF